MACWSELGTNRLLDTVKRIVCSEAMTVHYAPLVAAAGKIMTRNGSVEHSVSNSPLESGYSWRR